MSDTPTILKRIVERKHQEVAERRLRLPRMSARRKPAISRNPEDLRRRFSDASMPGTRRSSPKSRRLPQQGRDP